MFDEVDFDVVMSVLGRTHLFHILDYVGQTFNLEGVDEMRDDVEEFSFDSLNDLRISGGDICFYFDKGDKVVIDDLGVFDDVVGYVYGV